MTPIRATLERGQRVLDLTKPPYSIGQDLDLPVVERQTQFGAASFVNKLAGERAVSWRAANHVVDFTVVVSGESEGEVRHAIRKLADFLSETVGPTPLYLCLGGDSYLGFEPRWGQFGAMTRYQIVDAKVGPVPGYTIPDLRARKLRVPLRLTVTPFAHGLPQLLCRAWGGIIEDRIGTRDGRVRGLQVPEETTNKIENPVFQETDTWDQGWSTGTGVVRYRNRDKDFTLFGKVSAKVVCNNWEGGGEYTQTINVLSTAQHHISAYVKLPDGSAPNADIVQLYYGEPLTTTYEPLGEGWYRLRAGVTGVNAPRKVGIFVHFGYTVYLAGMQLEEKRYVTPLAHGDMPGCLWMGMRGNARTTRDMAVLQTQIPVLGDSVLDYAQGTIRLVWKAPPHSMSEYGSHPSNRFWFNTDTDAHRAFIGVWNDTFNFSDGAFIIQARDQSFEPGEILTMHFVWGPHVGLRMYRDGRLLKEGWSYWPHTPTLAKVFIGSNGLTANTNGTYLDFTTFAVAFTDEQVQQDYDNIRPMVESEEMVSPIPYLWTPGSVGPARVRNCNDYWKKNYAIGGGIPGSAPALTEAKMEPVTFWSGARSIWFSNFLLHRWRVPVNTLFFDFHGVADSSACGGSVREYTVGTSEVQVMPDFSIESFEHMANKDFYLFVRLRDAGTGLRGKVRVVRWITNYETEFRPLAADMTYRLFVLGPLPMWNYPELVMEYDDHRADRQVAVHLILRRVSGSALVRVDFTALMARPLTQIVTDLHTQQGPRIRESHASTRLNTDDMFIMADRIIGDYLEFWPGDANFVQCFMGADSGAMEVDDEALDWREVLVTPRWAVP